MISKFNQNIAKLIRVH